MTSASTKRRVSNRERMGRLFAAKDAEIQRLRAAMVHAMGDCDAAMRHGLKDRYGQAMHAVSAARSLLKTALEKK